MALGVIVGVLGLVALAIARFVAETNVHSVKILLEDLTIAPAEQVAFQEQIPLRAKIVPREVVYIDAIDGGRVDRIMVELGDMVQAGQPMIELSNTNLVLQVIQQESQLNQAISQLQQNEIALEQNKLSNERALADIEYHLVRLASLARRREALVSQGVGSLEQRDVIVDELTYYQHLKPIQVESGLRQAELRTRLLPDIHQQLRLLRQNLVVVHEKLESLVIRAPLAGRVTALELRVGENRSAGQRLAEVTPEFGMRLSADMDELYLNRVRVGQAGIVAVGRDQVKVTVRRVAPQVRGGVFHIDLDFNGRNPRELVAGSAVNGHLQYADGTTALVLPAGPFLQSDGGDSVFVLSDDNKSAARRHIEIGRRSTEQVEILSGIFAGERVVISAYGSLGGADILILTAPPVK